MMDISARTPPISSFGAPSRMQENAEASIERSLPRGRVRGEDLADRFNLESNSQLRVSVGITPNFLPESFKDQRKIEAFSMQGFF
ncbi:hypothetical protein LEP1GSC008_3752 [Leptospira kirschneri serovar Bulgarica str. Nikolaevo]|uniref:Uncharacterized protein n=2 Tax=Leptospira kirschneri TaxID=29507 RepID=A0A0E2B3K8_9LEPT|nr:hypothetical protein LEP1GSC081_1116 [Leptospira kirschneri str. H1]EMK23841.1 hypothetical protein LEP1GSC008_3752 [Leptospira kirschneri serovar Bulgarica str. Nikolaevo]